MASTRLLGESADLISDGNFRAPARVIRFERTINAFARKRAKGGRAVLMNEVGSRDMRVESLRGAAGGSARERELVADLRRGDESAYRELIARFGGRMLATARRLVRSEAEARDVFQDACLNAFRSIAGFREGSSLGTWLHRIVVNAALMRLRAARRRPEADLEPLLPRFDERGRHGTPVEPFSPEAALGRRDVRAQVRAAIDELPPTSRTVLVLRELEEIGTAETAERLGISENAVKIRLHRARQALATLLTPTMSRS